MKCPKCKAELIDDDGDGFLTCQELNCDWYGTEHQQNVIDLLAPIVRQTMNRDGGFCEECQMPNYHAHEPDCALGKYLEGKPTKP